MRAVQLLILLLIASVSVQGQNLVREVIDRFSVEAMAGMSNYKGELQHKVYTFDQAKPAFSLGGSLAITDRLYLRGLATKGSLYAADKYSSQPEERARNLSFYSRLYDASATVMYELLDIRKLGFTPYVFGGASLFFFNPYTYDTAGIKRTLFQRNTEGQGFPEYPDRASYSRIQWSVPFGGGVRFMINDHFIMGWELRFHKTFTDYIDDVSTTYVDRDLMIARRGPLTTELAYRGWELHNGDPYPAAGTPRGDPKTKDWIYYSGLTLSYKISGRDMSGKWRSNYGCPKVPL
ncbi:MAG: outer membrane beta-barrel protein [Chitinophagaceae bacterium]|nr:outer membrane beta-barrel protein [Chitinophagaceae bacterium]MCW5926363.1 outer membrane beta-barrel protein [Chitinophagaceae bacterium]